MIELGTDGILEKIEPLMEIVNLVLALSVIGVSLIGLKKAGGTIKSAWILVIGASLFVGILEFLGALKEFKIFQYHGLADIVEFLAILFLLLAIRKLKQLF